MNTRLDAAGRYLHWGVVQISLTNLLIVVGMIAVFALAVAFTMPRGRDDIRPPEPAPAARHDGASDDTVPSDTWTAALRNRIRRTVPEGQWLPDRQPEYVRSWIYVFGVGTLAALLVVLASGTVLAVKGVAWWHSSALGHFMNSVHLWSVELFFVCMVIHLWGKFFMAAWRGRRVLTWMTGVVAFLGSIGTAFTGYLSQSNFDSEWISTQAKDGLNAVGIGAFFNVLDPGQMLLWHVVLLPAVVGIIVVLHLLLVRRHGVVPPLGAEPTISSTVLHAPPASQAAASLPPVLEVTNGRRTPAEQEGARP